jgi:CRP/FNR family cyclic AMP-dependent transcriptional regulator
LPYSLTRNGRIEEDLVDQLFNSSEKRLARTLLITNFGEECAPRATTPKISQEMLAEIIGTTRRRVDVFVNKFRKLSFVDYNGDLKGSTAPC